jgi:hypothetical protein
VGPVTATSKPHKRPRDGPTLDKALLVSNGGGRGCTFAFFTYHCRCLFPREWDAANGGLRIDAYENHGGLDKRLQDKKEIPQERIAGDWIVDSDYDVRPALVTRYHPSALVRPGEITEAAGAGQFVFKTVEDGFVVDALRRALRGCMPRRRRRSLRGTRRPRSGGRQAPSSTTTTAPRGSSCTPWSRAWTGARQSTHVGGTRQATPTPSVQRKASCA